MSTVNLVMAATFSLVLFPGILKKLNGLCCNTVSCHSKSAPPATVLHFCPICINCFPCGVKLIIAIFCVSDVWWCFKTAPNTTAHVPQKQKPAKHFCPSCTELVPFRVTLIEAQQVLGTFDAPLREYAANKLNNQGVHLMKVGLFRQCFFTS